MCQQNLSIWIGECVNEQDKTKLVLNSGLILIRKLKDYMTHISHILEKHFQMISIEMQKDLAMKKP